MSTRCGTRAGTRVRRGDGELEWAGRACRTQLRNAVLTAIRACARVVRGGDSTKANGTHAPHAEMRLAHTHGQRELVRYNMQRTDGGVGPGADGRMGTAGASSVREHGPVCAAEHGDGRMHSRTVREAGGRAVLLAAAALTPVSTHSSWISCTLVGGVALRCNPWTLRPNAHRTQAAHPAHIPTKTNVCGDCQLRCSAPPTSEG